MLTSKLESVQKSVQRRWDPHFVWVINNSAPWAPMTKPLDECTLALVTTCGFYRADVQLPFDAWNDLGDPSFREIRVDTPPDRLRIAHTHYNHQHVAADVNVALPVAQLSQLVTSGVIGRLYPWVHSFMGYLPETRQLVGEFAPIVARRLKADGVDAVFLTPC
jgi:D-proline reductase (dithiol) PrdB